MALVSMAVNGCSWYDDGAPTTQREGDGDDDGDYDYAPAA